MSFQIDPAMLLSPEPSFVIVDVGNTGLLCRVSRNDPRCGGDREVILDFAEGPHGPTADVGGIRIDLDSGAAEFLPSRGKAKLLRRLWGRYRQRYPEFSHLEVRWAKMREILG
jgi:hypothetical protein